MANTNKLKNGDLHVIVPPQHEIINFSFGIEIKNRVFAYMRGKYPFHYRIGNYSLFPYYYYCFR